MSVQCLEHLISVQRVQIPSGTRILFKICFFYRLRISHSIDQPLFCWYIQLNAFTVRRRCTRICCLTIYVDNPFRSFRLRKKYSHSHFSRCTNKPTICICENKGTAKLRSKYEADQRLCFRYTDVVQFLFFLKPIFQASNLPLRLYWLVCVRPGRNPNCWFSHAQAHLH